MSKEDLEIENQKLKKILTVVLMRLKKYGEDTNELKTLLNKYK